MIRSLAFTTQGRLHSKNIEMFLMPTLLSDTNLFLWIDLEGPTPEETKFVLEDLLHFHPLSIEDCVKASPSPKVEEYAPKEEDKFSPYLFMVIHAVDYSRKDGVFATGELNFFLGKNFLVTYQHSLGEVGAYQLDVTYRCNEACIHCYLDHEDHGEMTTAALQPSSPHSSMRPGMSLELVTTTARSISAGMSLTVG